ncbi:MAG: GFA family protein [Rhodospirillaceae bacterium]|nr:GFA family protein [Rhodospirillaceae bacterium]MBT6137746.1 GFA family protein [Rhodospirillaceae bacterium]
MTNNNNFSLDGRCTCGEVKYRITAKPMFVHCCHCSWCQRETGSAFALNAMVEASHVTVLEGEPELVPIPTASGNGQKLFRCPTCRVTLWSNYAGAGDAIRFIRVGTLEDPSQLPPDIHIFTSTKQPWVVLPSDVPSVENYYDRTDYWPAESLARREALMP